VPGTRLLGVTLFVETPNLLLYVRREANQRAGITNVSPNGLRDPVETVGTEAEPFFVFELFCRTNQS